MSNASNWLEEAVLNHFFRNSPVSSPATASRALCAMRPVAMMVTACIGWISSHRPNVNFSHGSPTGSAVLPYRMATGALTSAASVSIALNSFWVDGEKINKLGTVNRKALS